MFPVSIYPVFEIMGQFNPDSTNEEMESVRTFSLSGSDCNCRRFDKLVGKKMNLNVHEVNTDKPSRNKKLNFLLILQ